MSSHVYGSLELTGSSTLGTDDAIKAALAKAGELVKDIRWFEVVGTRGHIEDGNVAHWQVTIRVGHRLPA